jgi:hypothetical protein
MTFLDLNGLYGICLHDKWEGSGYVLSVVKKDGSGYLWNRDSLRRVRQLFLS